MNTDFTIVPIAKEDNLPLKAIIKGVLQGFGFDRPGFASQDAELDTMYESYQQPGRAYFVVKQGERVVGGAGIAPLDGVVDRVCELRKMYLVDEVRGCGLGSRLMTTCLEAAKEYKYVACYLETTSAMVDAQKLYKRHGFELAQKRGDTGHHGCDLFFEKNLLKV